MVTTKNVDYTLAEILCLNQSFPDWNDENLPFRPDLNHEYTCTESVLSPAPSAVNNFTVVSYNIHQNEVTLDLAWYPPSITNGDLAPYKICVGEDPLRPNEEVRQNTRHFCEELSVSYIPKLS